MTDKTLLIRIKADMRNASARFARLDGRVNQLSRSLTSLRSVASGIGAVFAFRQVVQTVDAYTQLQGRLRLVTDSSAELASVQKDLFRLAQETQSELQPTAALYIKLARNADRLNLSQRDLLDLTRATNQAFQVSGATTVEASNATLQFSQALASGTLRGDEFNSVMENAPRLARAIADGLGVDIGKLRELSQQGKLTASDVTQALLSQADTIDQEFSKIPKTIGAAFTQITNEASRAIGSIDATPLVSDLDAMRRQLQDPATIQGIQDLAQAVLSLGAAAAKGGTEFLRFSRAVGEGVARLQGSTGGDLETILDRLAAINAELNSARLISDGRRQSLEAEARSLDAQATLLESLARDRLDIAAAAAAQAKAEKARLDINRRLSVEEGNLVSLGKRLADEEIKNRRASLQETLKTANAAIAAKRREVDALIREEERGARRIRELRQSIVDIRRTTAERIRDARRQDMTDAQRQADIEVEAAAKIKQAQAAILKGDKPGASAALSRLDTLAGQTTDTQQRIALLQKLGNLQEAQQRLALAREQKLQAARKQSVAQGESELARAGKLVAKLQGDIEKLGKVDPRIEIRSNIDEQIKKVRQLQAELQKLAAQQAATGTTGGTSGGSAGGNGGGGFSHGGFLGGYGGGDRIPAYLEAGEFVMRKEAVRRYGLNLMRQVNALRLGRFADGGAVGRVPVASTSGGDGGRVVRLQLDIGGRGVDLFGQQDQVDALIDALGEVARGG